MPAPAVLLPLVISRSPALEILPRTPTRTVTYFNTLDSVKIDDLRIPVGRHTLAPEEVGRSQRERLRRAILKCAGERGYATTTIADIVGVAGTSRSAFYEHFESKEACFVEAYERITDAFIAASIEASRDARSWEEALDAGIATYFLWSSERPEAARAFLVEIHGAGARALEARWQAIQRWVRQLKTFGEIARRQDPSLREPDELTCASVIVTAEAYAQDYVRRGRAADLPSLIPGMQRLARSAFSGGG
jgi:AcrR family transcriptional regulator